MFNLTEISVFVYFSRTYLLFLLLFLGLNLYVLCVFRLSFLLYMIRFLCFRCQNIVLFCYKDNKMKNKRNNWRCNMLIIPPGHLYDDADENTSPVVVLRRAAASGWRRSGRSWDVSLRHFDFTFSLKRGIRRKTCSLVHFLICLLVLWRRMHHRPYGGLIAAALTLQFQHLRPFIDAIKILH